MALLQATGLFKSFGGLKAVRDVGFAVATGTVHALIGPNGAGKTTLFNLIAGTFPPDSGTVLFSGRDITALPAHHIARAGIFRTYQNIKLFTGMTVLETVMTGLHVRGRTGFLSAMLRLPALAREERTLRERALALIHNLGIGPLIHRETSGLAFGEQRRVELARALVSGPSLLLMDEPAAGLNIQETRELAREIRRINGTGVTVLLVEHDMSLIMDIADRITVLSSGAKIAEGTPSEIQRNPEVVRVYLGEDDA